MGTIVLFYGFPQRQAVFVTKLLPWDFLRFSGEAFRESNKNE
jgi:hypothetical protein